MGLDTELLHFMPCVSRPRMFLSLTPLPELWVPALDSHLNMSQPPRGGRPLSLIGWLTDMVLKKLFRLEAVLVWDSEFEKSIIYKILLNY